MLSKQIHFMGIAVMVLLAQGLHARATDWIDPTGGDYSDGTNWSTATPPTATERALFNIGGATYTVDFPLAGTVSSQGFSVFNDSVLWNLDGASYTASTSNGLVIATSGDTALTISGGGAVEVNGLNISVTAPAATPFESAEVHVEGVGTRLLINGPVGNSGSQTRIFVGHSNGLSDTSLNADQSVLRITNGGVVETGDRARGGVFVGDLGFRTSGHAAGQIIVNGSGSQLVTQGSALIIGDDARGAAGDPAEVRVENNGTVNIGVGQISPSTIYEAGTLTLDGGTITLGSTFGLGSFNYSTFTNRGVIRGVGLIDESGSTDPSPREILLDNTSGVIRPGDTTDTSGIGIITLGNVLLEQDADGAIEFDINSAGVPGVDYDQVLLTADTLDDRPTVQAGGAARMYWANFGDTTPGATTVDGGEIVIDFSDPSLIAIGDMFDLVVADSVGGTLPELTFVDPNIDGYLVFVDSGGTLLPDQEALRLIIIPEPASVVLVICGAVLPLRRLRARATQPF